MFSKYKTGQLTSGIFQEEELCTSISFGEDECVLFLRGVKDTARIPHKGFEQIVEDGP